MRLIFLVQKNAWFVEHNSAWYRLSDVKQIELALGGLPMKMINQNELIEQPHLAGSAIVTQPEERTMSVAMMSPDDKEIDTVAVAIGKRVLLNVDWKTPKFSDGWMSADAKLTLDNVGNMYVDAFLPACGGNDAKKLVIQNEQTGSVREVWIKRDQKTRIAIVEEGATGTVELGLKCDPEPLDQTADPRQLGFVLVAEEVTPV